MKRKAYPRFLLLIVPAFIVYFPVFSQSDKIPEPTVPVYQKLKDLHLTTQLVQGAQPAIEIIAPPAYEMQGRAIQEAIHEITGVTVPLLGDTNAAPPFRRNVILLGNRSTNKVISYLYDRAYTFLDLKYPGEGGFVVRSLHNPLGDGRNVLFAGGSDGSGVGHASDALIEMIRKATGGPGALSVGYLSKIKLGKGYALPRELRDAKIWEASERYKSTGYFGWNMISKNMALYYMTGEVRYLKEFLRLSFPDEAIIREIDVSDGELIENKTDPLAGPYHYAAHMMIEMWDLIEESPALSDEERLKVTNAFARQLSHRVVEGVYGATQRPKSLGDRHGDWAAFSLYVLGRYFEKDYPSPVWERCLQAADQYFSTLKHTYWTGHNNDHLFWFTSFYDPLVNYLLVSGNRDPEMMANLRTALNTQQVISTGQKKDYGLYSTSLSMLNRVAYILNEGRWLYYRERINLETDSFRLGQSFWPDEHLRPAAPIDIVGKWNIQWMPEDMWKGRETGFEKKQSFRWGSYRSELGAGGDYLMLKGYNGAGRNPYHTFDVLELRLNGATLLKGYHNQVLTSADGMVEPKVAMDAALLYNGVTGDVCAAVAQVPDLPFVDWRRSIALRKERYAVIADDLGFRSDNDNLVAETTWETPGAKWNPEVNGLEIRPEGTQEGSYSLYSSQQMNVEAGKITTMTWRGPSHPNEHHAVFYLLMPNAARHAMAPASVQLATNAAALALPEAAIAVLGKYDDLDGEFVILSEKDLYGHGVRLAGIGAPLLTASAPVEVDWNFADGKLTVSCAQSTTLSVALPAPGILQLNGKRVRGKPTGNLFAFELREGKSDFSRANLSSEIKDMLSTKLPATLAQARGAAMKPPKNSATSAAVVPVMTPVIKSSIGGKPVDSEVIPNAKGDQLAIATGNTVTVLDAKGTELRKLTTAGDVRVLRWWEEPRLLLVGCADEKVIAFDEHGEKKWEFTSIMDPAVFEAGKQYWFKKAYPGIYGLYSGVFDEGKSRAFVGSAGTIEILDYDGQLVKRMPVFWGNPRQFMILDAQDGSKNLLAARWQSDRPNLAVVNSKKLEVAGYSYDGVPKGHTFVNGWMVMNRLDNYLADMDGDGQKEIVSAINGFWNRVSVYAATGTPLYNVQAGPGIIEPKANIRMMDVGDITADEKPEIIVALSSGFVDVLDGQTKKVWAKHLSSPPVVIKVIQDKGINWLCAGSEDGTVLALDAEGNIVKRGSVTGRPVDVQVVATKKGQMAVITTDTGEVSGFVLGRYKTKGQPGH